ncbi:MAG TPA: hypothetical protein PKD55_15540 [Bellilinea sp.]|nr:hypothetical protein [Bellilinea sp.]
MSDELETTVEKTQSESPETSGAGAGAEGKTYTQDDLNRMFADRVKRAEAAQLKRFGFDSAEAAESALKQARERAEAEKTELQKAQELAAQREKQINDLLASQKALSTQNDVTAKAAKLGIVDPDAAFKLLDTAKLEYDESGRPSNTEALLQSLLKDKPYLAGGGTSAANFPKGQKDAPTTWEGAIKERLNIK